ncbi:ExbD/TolR family protein [Pseudochryseolinea flava]|uniref:Biopolymer transporter ExbD n=1 Tax=Pseudochryseolinea flava TaxID=2059302 RepID=A0A364Y1G4_9BACT|nr:biopolymer transporter ExbD [Pseudochryseolinea flava]RAW00113.1 biopolymer transporter ExbD [Pseudochryseolinea flava]
MAEINSNSKQAEQSKVRCKRTSLKIDMTPMVDLAFLLLTFFILTTTLNKPLAMDLNMPEEPDEKHPAPPVPGKRVLTLILGKQDKIFYYAGIKDPKIEETNYSAGGLRKLLLKKKQEVHNLVVLIKPSEQSRYQNLVDMLDEISITGIKHYYVTPITAVDKDLIALKN